MKNYRLFFCVAFIVIQIIPTLSYSQDHNKYPFQSGENMELTVHYKWGFSSDIALISFTFNEVKEANQAPYYHLKAYGSTFKFWDSFFKVRDVYESKFTVKGIKPLYFHRDINEGGYTAKNWYTWGTSSDDMRAIVDKTGKVRIDTIYNIGHQIYDIVTFFYKIRTLDYKELEAGKSFPFTVAIDRNLIDISVRMEKKENKKIEGLGTFKTIKLAIKVKPRKIDSNTKEDDSRFGIGTNSNDELFDGEEKIFVWMSDDQNRLPLYFMSPVSIGSVNGRISKYKGVKYPLTSLIQLK